MADPDDPAAPAARFRRLQAGLAQALAAAGPGSTTPHVVVALPSHSMPTRLLDHNASHLPALEHRALLDGLRLAHTPGAHVVVVVSEAPAPEVLDHYAWLARPDDPDAARRRMTCLVVPDGSARGIAAKLLSRPDLLARLRAQLAGRPAVVEPWNVTEDEAAVALALDTPVNGGPPDLWHLGFKSASRRLFRRGGVPVPPGVEDVRDTADVAAAVVDLHRASPSADRFVVKLDNSGAGEGNWMFSTSTAGGRRLSQEALAERISTEAPGWFLRDLRAGGVVEQWVAGTGSLPSPSAQVELLPDGEVVVRATHEQVLGGPDGQVFTGSRFPADPAYSADLAGHATAVARLLADRGAVGWASVDFVVARHGRRHAPFAVDLNLRKGGTSHSLAALQHLVPGTYDAAGGRWVADADGGPRHYRSSDAVPVNPGTDAAAALSAVDASGSTFDHARGTGAVLHMLAALGPHGTVGVTAIGRTAAEAETLYDDVAATLAATGGP
ncbi:peptide ligase PGM1-related protein [Phycicoccus avicenniae]|uniref:peptide ligase PGM1-related protein n=1 Tax=Phycicoccus avicenniae TaxID=2828860 RepID=UPI003D266ADD